MKRCLLFLFLLILVGCQSAPTQPTSNPYFTSYQLVDINGRLEDIGKPYINTTPTSESALPLPDGYEYVIEEEAAVSPDGHYLIYYMQSPVHSSDLVIYNRDGSLYNRFDPTPIPGSSFFDFIVSEDNRIAFMNIRSDPSGVPVDIFIDVTDIDNSFHHSYPIGPHPDALLDAKTWSPDGTKIAYDNNGIKILDLATGEIQPLNQGSGPIWLNDHLLAYFHRINGKITLLGYDFKTQQTSTLLTLPDNQLYLTQLAPKISPDGHWLAVQLVYTSTPKGLASFCHKLLNLNPPAIIINLTCAPVLTTAMAGEYNLLLIDLTAPRLVAAIDIGSGTDNFAFSSNSQWFAYLNDDGIMIRHLPSGETTTYYQRQEGEYFSSLLWP